MKIRAGGRFNLTEPARKIAEYVALAEEKGLNGISWLSDSQLIWRDVYASLVLALQRTQNIHLGPGVTNPVTRDPTVTAGAIATAEELAPGRVVLGMGVGDSAVHTIHR
ncbi:MAG: LLM class flavin-dependent oxidoreductase, partial [Thaumarchaeota archaeon]|nr:LLM class flavin-dependent oxidoreductase [Nitrososphaerota archaeon]